MARSGVAEGNLPVATEVREQAQALVAAVQGGSVLSAVAGGPGPLQAALDAALGVLLRN